jgi:putative mRNA 3-end processing factor
VPGPPVPPLREASMDAPEIIWDRGVHLAGTVLWFDARRPDVLSVLSSARVRDAGRHARSLCTDRTRAIVRATRPAFAPLVAPFGRPVNLGPLEITMHPAGHMPGSSIVRVRVGDTVVLYASHVALKPHPMAEATQVPPGDVLVLRADYGHLEGGRLPPRAEALARVVETARATLSAGRTPVFLGSAMGKAQEVVRALNDAGVPVQVHRSVAAIDRAYRDLGFDPGPARQFRGAPRGDAALVLPETLRFRRTVQALKRARLVWLSGRAAVPEVLARMRVDEGIPLTGHLDAPGLERLVQKTGALRVYTVGHGAGSLAIRLRRHGIEATVLSAEVQLDLF